MDSNWAGNISFGATEFHEPATIDTAASTVTFEGGILHHELADHLHRVGRALPNLPSLPHFSPVGACATGTHGSGDTNRCLASAIRGMQIVTAGGDLVEISVDDLAATATSTSCPGEAARALIYLLHCDWPSSLRSLGSQPKEQTPNPKQIPNVKLRNFKRQASSDPIPLSVHNRLLAISTSYPRRLNV